MIEITAKQLYDIYRILSQKVSAEGVIKGVPVYSNSQKIVTPTFRWDGEEWKSTTDLIIKA